MNSSIRREKNTAIQLVVRVRAAVKDKEVGPHAAQSGALFEVHRKLKALGIE